jgi:hypothetical protein
VSLTLGRKARGQLQSRISSALVKFLSPVKCAISNESAHEEENKKRNFKQSQEQSQNPNTNLEASSKTKEKPKAELKLVTAPEQELSEPNKISQASENFMQVFTEFEEQRSIHRRSQGTKTYQTAVKNQKKAGIFRKGSMLDEDIS